VLALTLPPNDIQGFETRHLPAWSTAGGALIGLLVYFGLVRKRLLEGKAGPPQGGQYESREVMR